MIKVLFICHGNICRSPMAEFVFKDMVHKEGLNDLFYIESAATSREEIGNDIHYGTKRKLDEMHIPHTPRAAHQMRKQDYDKFDYLIGMDSANLRNMIRICNGDPQHKIHGLLEYANRDDSIADPWYTGNFDDTYHDVVEGCKGLLKYIKERGNME